VSALLYALLNGGTKYAWTSGTILGLFAAAVVLLAVFIYIEARVPEPMLPLRLFQMRVISASNIIGFLSSAVLIGVTAYLPLWIQGILGYSATNSGLTLLPMSIGWPIGSTVAGRIMYRIGPKVTALIGSVLITAGALWLYVVTLSTPGWVFIAIMVILGLGMGFATTPLMVLIQSTVGWNLRGAATAANSFTRSLGQTVGIAVYGTVFNQALTNYVNTHLPAGVHGKGWDVSRMFDPSALTHIPPQFRQFVDDLLETGLHTVFVWVLATAVVTLLATFLLPRLSNRPENR
jgi:predicted MFS family arabinose efflux permease